MKNTYFFILFLVLASVQLNAQTQQKTQEQSSKNKYWQIKNQIQRFIVGTGDHIGWRFAIGTKAPLSKRFSIGLDLSLWQMQDYPNPILFRDFENIPTIDIYSDNYPYPPLLFPPKTDYGYKSYTPQDNFWQAYSVDLGLYYKILDKKKWIVDAALGTSFIKVDYTFIIEEWPADIYPQHFFFDEEVYENIRILTPLYVRYIDFGLKMELGVARRFGRLQVGVGAMQILYTDSVNSSVGLNVMVDI